MTSKEAIIIVDEIGDLGKTALKDEERGTYRPSKIFGYGLVVAEDLDVIGDLAVDFKKLKNITGELKARDRTDEDKMLLAVQIRKTGAKMFGTYLDKERDIPEGWTSQKGSNAMLGFLEISLYDTLGRMSADNLKVILDRHEAYGDGRVLKIISDRLRANCGKKVKIEQYRSSSGEYANVLQAIDIVPHAMFLWIERNDDRISKELDMTVTRMGSERNMKFKRE